MTKFCWSDAFPDATPPLSGLGTNNARSNNKVLAKAIAELFNIHNAFKNANQIRMEKSNNR